jgi:hypothetical protein
MDRIYCTLAGVLEDLHLDGVRSEAAMLGHMEAASQYIDRHIGLFVPLTEARLFQGDGSGDLLVPPLLAVTAVTSDGSAVTSGVEFTLSPNGRHWPNGPYSMLARLDGGTWSTALAGVAVTGRWGMWEQLVELDLPVVAIPSTGTTLNVADGSKLSPGMVLRLDDEQLVVEASGTATDTGTDLNGAMTAEDVQEITVDDGTAVHVGEIIKIGFEQMRVMDISGNDLLVARAWNGTARAAHADNASVYAVRSFQVRRGCNGTSAASHSGDQIYRYVVPGDVELLCKQMTSLMYKKAETGYVGRSGNEELGGGYWISEFPKAAIEAVKSNYFWGGR